MLAVTSYFMSWLRTQVHNSNVEVPLQPMLSGCGVLIPAADVIETLKPSISGRRKSGATDNPIPHPGDACQIRCAPLMKMSVCVLDNP